MPTLDQSFSASNFHIIYNLLNRKGKIDIHSMSPEYQQIVSDIRDTRKKISEIKRKKKSARTEDEEANLKLLKESLNKLIKDKAKQLDDDLRKLAAEVNARGFKMTMKSHVYGTHEEYTLDTSSLPTRFAIAQLQHNLKRAYDVKMPGRHVIMTALKVLLNSKMPFYLIRTDVSGFFESIPQDKLMERLESSTLLSYRSRAFIKAILSEFEKTKNPAYSAMGYGVPRGVGISSLLSEIYMQDIDNELRSRSETIFYVRYVDDIILIIKSLGGYKDIKEYYKQLQETFLEYGLQIKTIGDNKCKLCDFIKGAKAEFEYLGYNINIDRTLKNQAVTTYGLSSNKKEKIKNRIDRAFTHFGNLSKIKIKQARRDLLDALNLITGNIKLKNLKMESR